METRLKNLKKILREMQSILIAFSGGVDSTFLVKVAYDTLGREALAVTARSPSYPAAELKEARQLACKIGIEHLVIDSEELNNEDFAQNPPRRCYFCKKELFSKLVNLAGEKGIKWVADATNSDDEDDFRPGREAAKELGIRSPLLKAKLSKNDIRCLSRKLGLPTWDKPAYACLASRFPYGEKITEEKLKRVDKAEVFLRTLGFGQLRLRHHDNLARIEVDKENISAFLDENRRKRIIDYLKSLGYRYITLDLQGYRTGSLNESLK
ncbi:ATP-dependent sacrificial sulfur transferase LarE [candidate division NPL-UPA2 bacterium]|nr:ATP-dependent sacrificial sulfur transferase LarE [candidate division NPL-UPA2 bacterium]